MDDGGLVAALDRAERALERVERALANRQSTLNRDDELRAKVREVVEELDELIRGGRLMAAMVDISIAGRTYQVACREGEEENLRAAARLVDAKSREALAGLGTLSESRQFLFASLLLADQMIEKRPDATPEPAGPDPAVVRRAESLARRLESLADTLERAGS